MWRLSDPDLGYRYAYICPHCGRRTGWRTLKLVTQQITDLDLAELYTAALRAAEYEPSDDGTCTGEDDDS
ncbi:hypothetical protein LCGC14_2274170 [marine sediment metagenome]|uniref:Uncharacterized protein n=1 Tax=marine sediment metagenome TaxID=412755 RepID=A0A0F9DIB1_9ZZZZ